MFDLKLQVFGIDIQEHDDSLEMILSVGLAVPGPGGEMAALPAGVIRYQIGKAPAEEISEAMAKGAAKIQTKPSSNLHVVSDPSEAARVANMASKVKKMRNDSKR